MRRVAWWLALASGLTAFGQAPVVSDLHTISIHVDGVESYNAAFRLLSQDFGLPVLYGKLLTAGDGSRRNYAGISAGNVVLEICGPYPKEFASGDRPARFHGLTFRPHASAEKSAAALKQSSIAFHGPVSWNKGPTFVIFDEPALVRPQFSISIMESPDSEEDRATHERGRKTLEASGGGPMGVRSALEAYVSYEDGAALDAWRRFLGEGGWKGGEGPGLRFVKGPRNAIERVVLRGRKGPGSTALLERAGALGIRLAVE